MASKMAFASLSVEDMVKIFNMVVAAFRTTTILIGRGKSPNNLTVMEYMAELKIMAGFKSKDPWRKPSGKDWTVLFRTHRIGLSATLLWKTTTNA